MLKNNKVRHNHLKPNSLKHNQMKTASRRHKICTPRAFQAMTSTLIKSTFTLAIVITTSVIPVLQAQEAGVVDPIVTYDGTDGVKAQIFDICTDCHASVANGGNNQSPHLNGYANALANNDRSEIRVSAGTMPPGSHTTPGPLSSALMSLLTSWADATTPPENAAPTYVSGSLATSAIDKDSVTFSASIYENGSNATLLFQYSTDTSFSNSTSSTNNSTGVTGGGTSATGTLSVTDNSLSCGTTYFYRARATNSTGSTNSHSSNYPSFTTDACNVAPVISSTAPTTATEDVQYSYQVVASDPGDAFTYSLSNEPSGMSISVSGLITWTPTEGVTTSGAVTVSVTDGGEDGVSPSTEIFTVSVTAVNDPPTITSTAPTTATEDTAYSYSVVVSDPDDTDVANDLSFTLTNEPSGMTISSLGVISWTPAEGVTASGTVTVEVADGGEDSASSDTENFSITATAVNDAPQITSTAPTTATEDVQYSYQVIISDPDDANNGTDLTFGLSNEPSGMAVSTTGLITWTPAEGVTSASNIVLTVNDGGENSASPDQETFSITVTQVNDPPTITSSAITTATESTLYSYQLTVSDPDDSVVGTELIFSLSNEPSGMTLSSSGLLEWTPANGVTTSGSITVSIADGGEDGAAPDTQTFTIAVTAVNTAPSITTTAPTTATEDTLYSYTVGVSDDDDSNNGTDISFSLSNEPTGMTVSNTGVITWTPTEGVSTSGTVTLTVADGGENGAAAATEMFTIAVTSVNDAPTITSTAGTTATEDSLYTYSVIVNDPDDTDTANDLGFSLTNAPTGMSISSLGVISWTPTEGVTTSGSVTVTVADGGEDGATADSETFTVSVTAVNDAPQITSTAVTAATEDVQFSYQAIISDPDDTNNGTDLTFSLSNAPSGMTVSTTGLVTWTPLEGVTSADNIVLTVNDGGENSAAPDQETFSITVTQVNDAPTITSTAATSAVEAFLYSYQVIVNDPDDSNNGTDLLFSLSNEPSGMTISSTGLVEWTPPNGVANSGNITLTVSDGGEDGAVSDTQVFAISVNAVNTPPSITTTAPTTATEDTLYTYTVGVSDADDSNNGTDITFTLSNAPSGMTVSNTGVINWTPTEGVSTSGTVTLTVADGGENGSTAATETFTITVTAVNDAPVITSTAPTSATEDTTYSYSVVVSDPDDTDTVNELNFALNNAPTGMTISNLGVISWTPTEGVSTSGAVNVTVSDGGEDGATAGSEVFTVNVTAVNDAPQITSTATTSATEDVQYSYQVIISDPDDNNNGTDLTFGLSNAPTGMAVSNTGLITWTPLEGLTSAANIVLTVSDGGEDSAAADTETFSINVTQVNDAPMITSTAAASAVEGFAYTYSVQVTDPDDSNNGTDLIFSLSGAPAGMTLSSTGLLEWTPPEDTTTSGAITITVADGGEDSAAADTQTFTIAVSGFNTAPVITSTAPTAATEDVNYTYQVVIDDIDDSNNGTDITFSLSNAPAGMTISNTGLVEWTPTEGVTTSGTVTLTAADGGENSAAPATESFVIAVTAVNDSPLITSTAPTTATEDTVYSYSLVVNDPDDTDTATDLTFSLSNAPTGMTISNEGVITWTPLEGVNNSGTITVEVRDGGEDSATADNELFSVAVTAVNDSPTITSTAPVTAIEDVEYTYQVITSDPDDTNNGTDITFALSNAPTGMNVSNTGLVTWTPTEGVTSAENITLTVSDGGEDSATSDAETFTINVTPVNDAPSITSAATTSAVEGFLYTYQVTVSDPDDSNNGSDLTFNIINAPTGDMAISNTGILTWTPVEGTTSSGEITISVADGGEDSALAATQTFTIVVSVFNTAPVITSTASNSATEDVNYTYQLVIDDIDDPNNGADLTFSLTNQPQGMTISNTGEINWTPTEGVTTSGTFTVSVADGGENDAPPATETITIDVTPVNDSPVITSSAPTAVVEANLYSYQLDVNDPDDTPAGLTFTLTNAPAGMTITELGLINWTPENGVLTSGEVTVSVSDGGEDGAMADLQSFTVAVSEFNTSPTITSAPLTTAIEDEQYAYQLEVLDIDDANNGTDLIFTLTSLRNDITLSNTGLLTWTPEEGELNSGELTLTVSDGGEDGSVSASQSFTILVTPVNDAPTITSTPPSGSLISNQRFSYQVEVADPDDANNGRSILFNLSNAPAGMTVSSTGLIEWTPPDSSPDNVTVIVSVSDGGEDNAQPATQTFTRTILFDIDNDGIVNGQDNCVDIANPEQLNFDGDLLGDLCDEDDDNDTLPDQFEIENGLDPQNPSDAELDSDGDGRTNANEFTDGGDLFADDITPLVTPPRNLFLPATGYLTHVELGNAIATDALNGPLDVTPNVSSTLFTSGRHQVQWSATDSNGNTGRAAQFIEILPLIVMPTEQLSGENNTVTLELTLSGPSPNSNAAVTYSVAGTASIIDHTLTNGIANFTDGRALITFDIIEDGLQEPEETIDITLSNPVDAVLGDITTHQIRIVDTNLAPDVRLITEQNDQTGLIVTTHSGLAQVTANVTDANGDETFTYDWTSSDTNLLAIANITTTGPSTDPSILSFDPMQLAPGFYAVRLNVSDTADSPANNSTIVETLIEVTDNTNRKDTDGDGIADSIDMIEEPFLLQLDESGNRVLETEPQLIIELGETSRLAGKLSNTLSEQDIANLSVNGGNTSTLTGTPASDIFDFTVRNLNRTGASVRIVISLDQGLPNNASYQKYINGQWQAFVEDDFNSLESAPLINGVCPGIGSDEYSLGLLTGDQCVRLTIEDGGPNDNDNLANGTIEDPGVIVGDGTSSDESSGDNQDNDNTNVTPVPTSRSGGGGGSSTPELLLLLVCVLLRKHLKSMYHGVKTC